MVKGSSQSLAAAGLQSGWLRTVIVVAVASFFAAGSALADEPEGGLKDGVAEDTIAHVLPHHGDPGGVRKVLSERGVTYGLNYVGEVQGNLSGGVARRTVYVGRLEGYVDLDFEKIGGWKGLTLHANAYQIHGDGLSTNYLKNLMPVSYIEAHPTTRLFELWLEQRLLDDMLSVRFGQLAADSEFLTSSYATQFINGTFGWPAFNAANLPSGGATYPLATPGVRVQVNPTKQVSLLAGVFNGDPAGPCASSDDPQECNRYGTNFRVSDPAFVIGEAQYRYNQEKGPGALAGTIKVGAWHHFGKFDDQRFDVAGIALADGANAGPAVRHRGNTGIYGVIDQQIWRPESGEPNKGVGFFLRGAGSPSDRNVIDLYFDGGLVFAGMVPGRPDDSFGFGLAYARISNAARDFDADDIAINGTLAPVRDYEAAFEANYAAQIVAGWMVDLDFQYIWHPGGNVANSLRDDGTAIKDAAVLSLHTSIKY